MPTAPDGPPKSASVWHAVIVPWFVCLIAAIFYAYDFLLRVAPSVMIHPLMHSLQVDATMIGFISAFYYYAYTPLQIPSGLVIDRFNVQLVLVLSIGMCVIGAVLFALFPTLGVILIARLLMGLGSAFAFVGTLKLASRWIEKKHYALFAGVTTALGTLGAVSADAILSRLVSRYGWQEAMLTTAYIGIAIGVVMVLFVRDRPSWLKPHHIPKAKWSKSLIRLWIILKTPGFWYNGFVGCILFIPVNVVASLWGIAFLIQGKHFAPTQAATITSLIFIGTAIGCPVAGWFSDYIKSRKIPLYIGTLFILILTVMLLYFNIESHLGTYIILFLLGFFTGSQVLVFAVVREISPPHTTGISTAATNFLVTIGAAIFQPLIGYLLDLSWAGKVGSHGFHLYTLRDFKLAFMLIPILTAFCFILIMLMPRTRCQRLYEQPEDIEHVPYEKKPYYVKRRERQKK